LAKYIQLFIDLATIFAVASYLHSDADVISVKKGHCASIRLPIHVYRLMKSLNVFLFSIFDGFYFDSYSKFTIIFSDGFDF